MLNNIHRLAGEDFTPHANHLLSQPPTSFQERWGMYYFFNHYSSSLLSFRQFS